MPRIVSTITSKVPIGKFKIFIRSSKGLKRNSMVYTRNWTWLERNSEELKKNSTWLERNSS
jgi:hypothetical protein